ncbi:MAG: VCBS repeat-containing protein [Marinoscillum sp.]
MLKKSILIIFSFYFLSCEQQVPEPTMFELVDSKKTGITFVNELVYSDSFNIIDYLYYYNGGGLAVGDINNDGLEDIYFSSNNGENKLYLNKGSFQFQDITESAGLRSPGAWKTGVTMADVNGDNLLDIYLCRIGDYKGVTGHNELYINNGDNTFTESSAKFGLDFQGFSTQAAFFDYDIDGDLDMYLLNHSIHTVRSYGQSKLRFDKDSLAGDRLYRNDDNQFVNITTESGIYTSQIGYGLGLAVSDINLDGYPDIYVSNDFHENDYLYLNNGDGTFTESIKEMIGHTSRFSMGNDISDLNNDGAPEIMTLDMLPDSEEILKNSAGEDPFEIYRLKLDFGYEQQFARNALQLNNGDGTFSEVALMMDIAATDWSWSPLFADYDLDGYKDLFITNGIVKRPNDLDYVAFMSGNNIDAGSLDKNTAKRDKDLVDQMPEGKVSNRIFKNIKGESFESKTGKWMPEIPSFSTSAAYVDLDLDGDLDLVVNNINDEAFVLRNNTSGHHYIKLELQGNKANTKALGAKAVVYTGSSKQFVEHYNVHGFQSSGTYQMTIGLDDAKRVDSLQVIWPGGLMTMLRDLDVDATIRLSIDSAKGKFVAPEKDRSLLIEADLIHFKHQENPFVDFNYQSLIPHVVSREGPDISIADMNDDGKDDLYITSATAQSGRFFLTSRNELNTIESTTDPRVEETATVFFDADGDSDLDMLVVSGGNQFEGQTSVLADRLFINDGNGGFTEKEGAIPTYFSNGSVAVTTDVDGDEDMDVFVGSRVISSQYGSSPDSYLLINDREAKFSIADTPDLRGLGMVTDAVWEDLDGDGFDELFVVGEWMNLTILKNESGKLSKMDVPSLENTSGWWNCIEKVDIDSDGDMDFVVGNQGFNTKLTAGRNDPVRMYVKDFDGNDYLDQIITYSISGKEYPVANRDELAKQMPIIKKSFTNYGDFSGKTVQQVLSKESLESSIYHEARTFESGVIINNGSFNFTFVAFPRFAQISPIFAIQSFDFNQDGQLDLLIGGNRTWANTYFGASDASYGMILINTGNGIFEVMSPSKSGLKVEGDVRSIKHFSFSGSDYFIFGVNDDRVRTYTFNLN